MCKRYRSMEYLQAVHRGHEMRKPTHDIFNTHTMVELIAKGTCILVLLLLGLVTVSYLYLAGQKVLGTLAILCLAGVYSGFTLYLARTKHFIIAAWMLVGFYLLIASGVLYMWGINTPFGLLLLNLVVAMAGVMLGARYVLATTGIAAVILLISQAFFELKFTHPSYHELATRPYFGDALGYIAVLGIIALISWLSRNRLEQSLDRALRAEKALEKEKRLLASRLERRTRELRLAQVEEMRQLYRFAELGQTSAAILHELANHLTVVMLSIDDLEQQHRQSREIASAKESIAYIEKIVLQIKEQVASSRKQTLFNAVSLVRESVDALQPRAERSRIALTLDTTNHNRIMVHGDSLQFTQAVTIVVTNAIEAFVNQQVAPKTIQIVVSSEKATLLVQVIDNGPGIAKRHLKHLFKPHKSMKSSGMGIGLFIARQMLELQFGGSLTYRRVQSKTIFTLSLPL